MDIATLKLTTSDEKLFHQMGCVRFIFELTSKNFNQYHCSEIHCMFATLNNAAAPSKFHRSISSFFHT